MRSDILEQKDQILQWIDENQSKAYMSQQLGCKWETLNRYLKLMGIEKNRKRKLAKHKKLSNNTIIEIDNCSPLEILKLQKNLLQIAEQEQITFVYGKGKRKPEIQQLYEELEACGERLMGYKECFEIMGRDRNETIGVKLVIAGYVFRDDGD